MSPTSSSNNSNREVARSGFLDRMIHDNHAVGAPATTTYYKRYAEEFCLFANHFYGNKAVDEEKLYHFLMYTAYRKQRPRTSMDHAQFDLIADVIATEERFSRHNTMDNVDWEKTHIEIIAVNPEYKPVGISQFHKYRGGLKGLAELQEPTEDADRFFKSGRIKRLTQTVRKRKSKNKSKLMKEVPFEGLIPYKIVPRLPEIEQNSGIGAKGSQRG